MQKEQIKMSDEQAQQISNMLQEQGMTPAEINEILNGEYTTFQTDADLVNMSSFNGNHQNVLRGFADGYSIEELQQHGVSQKDIEEFLQTLEKCNLTVENAKAINQYSNGSNMILSIKRGTVNKDEIQNGIKTDMMSKLQTRELSQGQISSLENYIGKSISNKGYTSTTLLYKLSFAKYDDYDTVMEIYAPKGTLGSYIAQLSDYDNTEQEVLLNSNDIYFLDARKNVRDPNGKIKTVLKCLLLSKERECYKGIDKRQEIPNTQQSLENNLPVKQNRFSRFFNRIRSKFTKQFQNRNIQRRNPFSRKKDNIQQYEEPQKNVKEMKNEEKKSWELEPEEKAKMQRKTVEITKKHGEKEEQKNKPTKSTYIK